MICLVVCLQVVMSAKAKSMMSSMPKQVPARRSSVASSVGSTVAKSTQVCASVKAKQKRAAATAGSKALAKALSLRSVEGMPIVPTDGVSRDENGSIICRRCKVKGIDPDNWAKFVNVVQDGVFVKRVDETIDACKKCYRVYEIGFTAGGTWEEVTMETDSDPNANSEFEGAVKVFDGMAKLFKDEEVHERRGCGARALVVQRGLRPAEFALRFQRSHEDLGLPLQNLFHPDRSCFQGVLVKDDGNFGGLGVIYEYWSEFGADFTTKHMTPTLQLHPLQGKAAFDHLLLPSGGENENIKRLRLANVKNLNVESIQAAIRTLETQQQLASDLAEDEAPTLVMGTVPCNGTASQLGLATLEVSTPQGSRYRTNAVSLDGDMDTPYSEKEGQELERVSLSGGGLDDPVEQRIVECCLSVILGGKRLGHKRRRIKDIMDELYLDTNEATRAESQLSANRYAARLKSADYADKVADEVWVLSTKNEHIVEAVDDLIDNGASFTSSNMESFLKRRFHGFGMDIFSSEVHMESFLHVACAWCTPTVGLPVLTAIGKSFLVLEHDLHFATSTELSEFIPLRATMATIDGGVLDKSISMTKSVFTYFFSPLMANFEKIGSAPALTSLLLLDKGLAKAPADTTSDWADTAYAMIVAARFMVHLINPLDKSYVSEFEDALECFALDKQAPWPHGRQIRRRFGVRRHVKLGLH
jgi:hypothetical protein